MTTIINNTPLRTQIPMPSQMGDVKAPASRDQVDIADVGEVVARAAAYCDALENLLSKPELTAPSAETLSRVTSQEWLQKVVKDENFIQQAEQGLKSIVGLAHRSTELIDKFASLLLSLTISANKTTQRNIVLGSELAELKKDSQYREGMDALSGSISGASVSTALAAGGTAMSLRGSGIKGDALKQNKVKVEQLTTELKLAKNTLSSQSSVKLGADQADAVTELKVKTAPGAGSARNSVSGAMDTVDGAADSAVQLQSSNKQLDQQQMAALHRPTEQIESDISAQELAYQQNTLKGGRLESKGSALSSSAQAANAITRGSGEYAATIERADQTILNADQQVANTAAEKSSEEERKLTGLLQDLLRILTSMMQDSSAASSAIASNRPG